MAVADLHKLLGAATFGWNLVVAMTGVLLCFSGLLLQLYAATELAKRGEPFKNEPVVTGAATMALGAQIPDPTQVPVTKNGLNAQRGYARPTLEARWLDPRHEHDEGGADGRHRLRRRPVRRVQARRSYVRRAAGARLLGKAEKRFDVEGWTFNRFKVR